MAVPIHRGLRELPRGAAIATAGLAVLGLLSVAACSRPTGREPGADDGQLVWEPRELERFAGECDSKDAPCGRFSAEYPEFAEAPAPGVADSLNAAVDSLLTDDRGVPLATMANEFIAAYRAARQEFPGAASTQSWEESRVVSVLYHDAGIVSLALAEYSFTGGAHPNARMLYGAWSLADGVRLGLGDLLASGYEETLSVLGEGAFREVREIPAGQSLEEAGFEFPEGRFHLPDNFAVTGEGLIFFYNPYEIAPYALGPTELDITLEELGGLIRADGPLGGE